jgi:trimeric autotransporter adhesin
MKKRYLVLGLAVVLAVGVSVPALGGPSATSSASAKKTAKKALKKAKKAQQAANDAQNAADAAQGTANTALDTANQALGVTGGPTTPSQGASLVSFNARLGANESFSRQIGNFTVQSATNNAGTCGAIQLAAGNADSQRSIGLNAGFANLAPNTTANITAANVSQAFTAVTDDGSSGVSGVVGRAQQGNTCLLSGYMTGQ